MRISAKGRSVSRAAVAAAAGLALLASPACYGPFNLTRTIYRWNGQLEGTKDIPAKWMREGVFVALVLIPVYPFSLVIDALFFNSVEFWTGENPIKVSRTGEGEGLVITIGETVITASAAREGEAVPVAYSRNGQVFARGTIHVEGDRYSLRDEQGQVLVSAELAPTGAVLLVDRDCRLLGAVSADQVGRAVDRLATREGSAPTG
ncbi:DUF3332 family protein [Nitrospira sp. Kam-Ns4a]